jgi:hypothetical protein
MKNKLSNNVAKAVDRSERMLNDRAFATLMKAINSTIRILLKNGVKYNLSLNSNEDEEY